MTTLSTIARAKWLGQNNIALHPIRKGILRSINSREKASVFGEIYKDIPNTKHNHIEYHLNMLIKYGVLYACDNYMNGRGRYYSIYWSDEAQQASLVAFE